MRIFLFEFVTGGGFWEANFSPNDCGLLSEAIAMTSALASDLAAAPGVELLLLWDSRLSPPSTHRVLQVDSSEAYRSSFDQCVRQATASWLIAPESDGCLSQLIQRAECLGGRLLSPGLGFAQLCADKARLNRYLRRRGLPVPRSMVLDTGESLPDEFSYPAVLKDRYGAGSEQIWFIAAADRQSRRPLQPCCLEEYHEGTPVSVAVLAGGASHRLLPPCLQKVCADRHFHYAGGRAPIAPHLAERATELAGRVARALPPTRGYFGMDLVLGPASDGSQDVVIEVNPRLTTSYCGLRELAVGNLGAAALAFAAGETPELAFREGPVEWHT